MRALRGVSPLELLLLLLIAAVLAAMAIGFNEPGPSPGGEAPRLRGGACRVDGLHVKLWLVGDTLNYSIQAPNPCYRIENIEARVEAAVSTTAGAAGPGGWGAEVVLTVDYSSPEPGTVCIQVLPPPVQGSVRLPGGGFEAVTVRVVAVDARTGSVGECRVALR